jgi:hypothetical protein
MTTTIRPAYTNRDFSGMKAELSNFVKNTNLPVWSDFFQSNLGVLLIDMLAYVGDIESFGQDSVAVETFLSTCKRYESALAFAKSVGYVPRPRTAASAPCRSVTIPTTLVTNGGTVRAGGVLTSDAGLSYELLEPVVVPIGATAINLSVVEGVSRSETLAPTNSKNQTFTSAEGNVADASWEVWVGPTTNPNNLWTQVDFVQLESTPTQTYSIAFDAAGRLVVTFGDDAAGQIPTQTVTVRYRTCSGAAGNTSAGSINGSLTADVTGGGTASIPFQNYDASSVSSGGSTLQSGEVVGTTTGISVTSTFILAKTPTVAGQVNIVITLPGAGGSFTLKDDSAGAWTVVANTTIYTLASGAFTYSSGVGSLTFNLPLPAGAPIVADYYYYPAPNDNAVVVIGAATGGEDAESLTELRTTIPAYIRSQDRLVTIADYRSQLTRVAGVALSYAELWVASYTGNVVNLYAWSAEPVTFLAQDDFGGTAAAAYTRYTPISTGTVRNIQQFVRDRTLLTVHHVVYQPDILWVDVYLGNVTYDGRYARAQVMTAVTQAVVAVFQDADGFSIRLSDIYRAGENALGVKHFEILRLTVGYRSESSAPEEMGVTAANPSVSGTLSFRRVTPGSVVVTIPQGGANIVLADTSGDGTLVITSGPGALVSATVDYVTGAVAITFTAPLTSGFSWYATYRDVVYDYRANQNVIINELSSAGGDLWPPSDTAPPAAYPATPPYKDGLPLTAGPYTSLTPVTYAPLQDILIDRVVLTANFYDDTYLYDDEIYYDSSGAPPGVVRAINLRSLRFNPTAG